MRDFVQRLVNAILKTRFVPVETIVAIGLLILGFLMAIPGSFSEIAAHSYGLVRAMAVVFMAVGGFHLYGLSHNDTYISRIGIRRFSSFLEFLSFSYVSALLWFTFGSITFGWFGFLLLALVSGTAYLSLILESEVEA